MNLTKAETKALLSRCEQHTGVRESKALQSAMDKMRIEIASWPVKDNCFVPTIKEF